MLYDVKTATCDETAQCYESILRLQRKSNIPGLIWTLDTDAMNFLIDAIKFQFIEDCYFGTYEADFVGKCAITVRLIESMLEAKQSGRDESDYWQGLKPNSDYNRRDGYIMETLIEYLVVTDDHLSDALSGGVAELEWAESLYNHVATFNDILKAMLS